MRFRPLLNRAARAQGWALITSALCLALTACGAAGANSAPAKGWTDITPPDSRQVTAYAVSPDIPGLLLAEIGGRSAVSAAPPLPAQLWRSRDGGATWQTLDNLHPPASFGLLMPPGGHGMIFAQDPLQNMIYASDDAGTTWRTLRDTDPNAYGPVQEWTWLAGAVAIGGRLYAGGVAAGWGGQTVATDRFSVSDDLGGTWRPLEASIDPAGPQAITQAIAPLDAAGASWLRLVATGEGPSGGATVERSADGGVTWRIISTALSSGKQLMQARLATNTARPGKVCATLTTWGATMTPVETPASSPASSPTANAFHGGAALAAPLAPNPPAPEPKDISLLASDDGGATWRGGEIVALHGLYGGIVNPGVQMSADGACYVATAEARGLLTPQVDEKTILWRLATGATAATQVWTITDRGVLSFFLAPGDAGKPERMIALTRISGAGDGETISCGQDCTTLRDGGVYRLVWQPLPAA
ncbi:MAG TPA: sialidase family protein [Ktedonobacterales bacterium]